MGDPAGRRKSKDLHALQESGTALEVEEINKPRKSRIVRDFCFVGKKISIFNF
jgi:hypothetical protein